MQVSMQSKNLHALQFKIYSIEAILSKTFCSVEKRLQDKVFCSEHDTCKILTGIIFAYLDFHGNLDS